MAQESLTQRLMRGILPAPPPPPKNGERVRLPETLPNQPRRARIADAGMQALMGALGLADPLSETATPATGLGAILGMVGPAAMMGGVRQVGRGLYSRLDDAVKLIPAGGAHPNKVLGLLKNNASGEELAYRGVPEWLAAQGEVKVTPEALQGYLAGRPAPMPVKKVLGHTSEASRNEPAMAALEGEYARLSPDDVQRRTEITQEMRALIADQNRLRDSAAPPKYAQYTVPGGTNYRETLSVMPPKPDLAPETRQITVTGAFPRDFATMPEAEDYIRRMQETAIDVPGDTAGNAGRAVLRERLQQFPMRALETIKDHAKPNPGNYISPHFDTPNILVHSRSNQRTLPTGERGTLVENVQSDWHQAGRKEGYQQDVSAQIDALQRRLDAIPQNGGREGRVARTTERAQIVDAMNDLHEQARRGVPDAPFKESWPALGLKQEVLDAVERGDDWIGITPASILNSRGEAISEAFQDQRLPLTLEKILQGFGGGRVERGRVVTAPPDLRFATGGEGPSGLQITDGDGPTLASVLPDTDGIGAMELIRQMRAQGAGTPATVEAFLARLTPEMREQIKKRGLPLLMAMLATQDIKPTVDTSTPLGIR